MSETKELSKVQQYAVSAAAGKVNAVQSEFQILLQDIARELGINLDDPEEAWGISANLKYLERRGKPKAK